MNDHAWIYRPEIEPDATVLMPLSVLTEAEPIQLLIEAEEARDWDLVNTLRAILEA